MPKLKIESEINLEGIEDDTTTNFSDTEQVEVERVNFELEQGDKLHGFYRKITVFNDTQCYQLIQNKHQRKHKYRVDIAYLEARPFRMRVIEWKWLWASLVLFALDLGLISAGQLDTASVNSFGLFIGITVVALMCLLAFFYYMRDKVYFRSQYGKIKLIELINANPNKAEFRRFIHRFCQQIIKSKTAKELSQHKFLTSELQELRRLNSETVIPSDAYEKAKQLIFRHKAFKNA